MGRHGPHTGLDMALPLFERTMLDRSARMVKESRQKAKEMHSSLAKQPARKVNSFLQRKTGVDMPEIIRVLRAKGIGAHSANDPRGLDAVVAQVIDSSYLREYATALPNAAEDSIVKHKKLRKAKKQR